MARESSRLRVEIEGTDLPGRRCGPNPVGHWYENIHVGVRHRTGPVELVPGDAPCARWELDVATRPDTDGAVDFGGPFVRGKRGERCLDLVWGEVGDDGSFALFRAAKLRLADIDPSVVRAALRPGRRLVGRLGLTDAKGHPRCASVRPPDITWSADQD
jgi:hypothetical protein